MELIITAETDTEILRDREVVDEAWGAMTIIDKPDHFTFTFSDGEVEAGIATAMRSHSDNSLGILCFPYGTRLRLV